PGARHAHRDARSAAHDPSARRTGFPGVLLEGDRGTQVVGDVNALLDAALRYAQLDWPSIACYPRSKEPLAELVPHGVKDATTDAEVLHRWFERWPEANLAIACGSPGPQPLDIDNPPAVPADVAKAIQAAARTASPRGGAAFFAGTDAGTINL